MEAEKGNNDNQGGAEAKSGDANNDASESKAETPATATSDDSTTEANNNSNKSPDQSKGKDVEEGNSESGSKEDQKHVEGEAGNDSPRHLVEDGSQQSQTGDADAGKVDGSKRDKTLVENEGGNDSPKNIVEDGSQQSQTGGADASKVEETKARSGTTTASNSGDNDIGSDPNTIVKKSSLPPSSSSIEEPTITKTEEIEDKTEEIEDKTKNVGTMEEEKDEDVGGNKPVDGNSSERVGNNIDEEAKGSLTNEAEPIIEDVSLEEQKTSAILETDESPIAKEAGITDNETKATTSDQHDVSLEEQKTSSILEPDESPIANEANISDKEGKTTTSDQHSENATEPKGEEKETVDTDGTKLNTDESLLTTGENSIADKNEDENAKMDLEITTPESNEKEKIPHEEDDTSTKMDLVQSNNAEVDTDPIMTTSFTPNAENTHTVMEEQKDEDDAFEDFQKKRCRKKKKAKKQQFLKIKIAGMSTEITRPKCSDISKMADVGPSVFLTPDALGTSISCHDSLISYGLDEVEKELEDSLEFFEQPHEDQDPTYTEFLNKEKRDHITLALKNLRVEDETGRKEIGVIVNQQLKDKQGSTERYIEKHRLKMATDQKSELARLQQTYSAKSLSNKGKIDHGIAVLRKKHSDETQKYHQQHRQQVQQRRVPEQIASSEWAQIAQRLTAKHNRQMHDFSRKGKEVMNKCKVEFERERTKLTKIYEKRLQDLSTQRQNLYNRIYANLQQIRQRHLRRHVQSIVERRESMELELASTQDQQGNEIFDNADTNKQSNYDIAKSGTDERLDLRPVSPIKTATDWRKESVHEPSGAATRHKHRKGVLSQINRQLSVEIHNEGIWLSELSEKKNSQKKDSSDSAATAEGDKKCFFPWGVKARKILESIVCGEIPHACDSLKFNFSETVAQNGGHIRCVMTDLRTSDATASAQRAEAIMKKELDELKKQEEREAAIKNNMAETEKNMEIIKKQIHDLGVKLKETVKDYEKTKQHLQGFRTKYSNFFGSDGKPLPTNDPGATRKLTQHGMKYKMAIESSEKRAIAIKRKLSELQQSLQKRQTMNKSGQRAILSLNAAIKSKRNVINEVRSGRLNLLQAKSIENPTTRVKETINILGLTADMRRDQLNQKRNSNTSSQWVQSLPEVPGPLRRSLWYKMHRRRQQIVLRPTFSSMLTNMRNEIESKLTSIDTGIRRVPKEAIEDKLVKAEQSYLLVTHPVEQMNENLNSLPSSSAWAEPGWHLKLDVNKEESLGDRILPCPFRQPLVQYNLSELCSAPGRQAASMINSTHLRSLETPLSAVATATSLSETDPAMAKSADPILSSNDPLKMTRDALKLGYAFSVNKASPVRPTVMRRKSSSTKDTAPTVSAKGTKKKQSASTPSDSGVSKIPGAPPVLNAPRVDNSRKRKNTTQADPKSAPRVVQRKRTEPSRQIPVDDQAFQPRPIMTQPQQQQQQQQQQPTQPAAPFLQQAMPQQQQNPYNNQYMNTMPSPVAPQQQANHRGSFNQFQNNPQMNQFRMMQQQQSHHQQQQHHPQHSNQQKVNYGQIQQQPMRPNPQFFPQMGQQQFPQQPMQMPGQGGMQMNVQGNNQVRHNMATSDEQNDPLFMLK